MLFLLFSYGIDTHAKLSNQLQTQIEKGKRGSIRNSKIAHFAYNPINAQGYETLKREQGSHVQGQIYQVGKKQLAILDKLRPRHTRIVKLITIPGEATRKRCFVYVQHQQKNKSN